MKIMPHFSPATRAGQLVFVSGQMALGPDFELLRGGIQEQTVQCLENIRQILATEGLELRHVVKTMVWLQRTEDFAEFNRAYAAVFTERAPSRSTVRADLMIAGALVEIEAIALRA